MPENKDQTTNHRTIGQRGELLVAEKLIEHGWVIAYPLNSNPAFDLLASKADKIWRVQVKTTQGLCSHSGSHSPNFQFQTNHGCKRKVKYTKASLDFFILCALDCSKFWVVPFDSITSMTTKIYGGKNCQFAKYENAWELLSGGN